MPGPSTSRPVVAVLLLAVLLRAKGSLSAAVAASSDCRSKNPIVGIEGKHVILSPVFKGTLAEVFWKKGADIVAEGDDEGARHYSSLKGRGFIDMESGNLTIKKLYQNDTGEYTAEVLVGNQYQFTYFCLQIIGELQSPHLNCSANNKTIWLSCTPDFQDPPVIYRWEIKDTVLSDQPEVSIEESVDRSEEIKCTIFIANSNASTSLRLEACYPPGPVFTRHRIITIVLFIAFSILMAAAGFLVYRKVSHGNRNTVPAEYQEAAAAER